MAPPHESEWRIHATTGERLRWSSSKDAWVDENGNIRSIERNIPESSKSEWRTHPKTREHVRYSKSKDAWVNVRDRVVSKGTTLPDPAPSEWRTHPTTGERIRWSKSKGGWINDRDKFVSKEKTLPEPTVSSSTRSQDAGSSSKPININRPNVAATGSGNDPSSSFQRMTISPTGTAKMSGFYTGTDPTSQVETLWGLTLLGSAPDPSGKSPRDVNLIRIREGNRHAQKTSQSGYSISQDPSEDYKPGRVIEVLLVPPTTNSSSGISHITPSNDNNLLRRRRFVIVEQGSGNQDKFRALAIKTYNGRGVAWPGVIKSHHSPIHTGQCIIGDNEKPTNPGQKDRMQAQAIFVHQKDRAQALDPKARVDYTDIYELDYDFPNIKIFGRVHADSNSAFFMQYRNVWSAIRGVAGGAHGSDARERRVPDNENVAGMAPPRPRRSSFSSTRTVVPGSSGQASGQPVDYTKADSGPMTDAQMNILLQNFQTRANENGWTMGRIPGPAQIRQLAENSQQRAGYLQGILSRWNVEARERSARANDKGDSGGDDDDSGGDDDDSGGDDDDNDDDDSDNDSDEDGDDDDDDDDNTRPTYSVVRRS